MSTIDRSMIFFNGLPKPVNLERNNCVSPLIKVEEVNDNERSQRMENSPNVRLIDYDVTISNLDFVARDLVIPFEYLSFFENLYHTAFARSSAMNKLTQKSVVATQTQLTEIKRKIIYRTEKGQSLSEIPNLIACCLEKLTYDCFTQILQTFMDILWTWINGVRMVRRQKSQRKLYTSTPEDKYDISRLESCIAKLFADGLKLCNHPALTKLNYSDFQAFIDKFGILHDGPFRVTANGHNLIAIFLSSKVSSLRYFNGGLPLFGIIEFNTPVDTKSLEPLPKWFYKSGNEVQKIQK